VKPKRRGLGILELTVAGILVGLLATAVMQLVVVSANQHRALAKRHVAIQESANVMERLSVTAWEELTAENVAKLELSEEARKSLAGATLEIEITGAEGDPAAKRIKVVIRWPDRPGRPDLSVRLLAWRYRTGGEA
jgi:hypothetical protein